jgi:hypothetical protein
MELLDELWSLRLRAALCASAWSGPQGRQSGPPAQVLRAWCAQSPLPPRQLSAGPSQPTPFPHIGRVISRHFRSSQFSA